jgi:HSP20 family molecular chaperone IbpA
MNSRRGSLSDDPFYEVTRRRSSTTSVDFPTIVEHGDGSKEFNLGLYLPTDERIEPDGVHIKTTDRDLIVEVDNKSKSDDGSYVHEFHYERRSTLPVHTNMDGVKCVYDHDINKLTISAPIQETKEALAHRTTIPVEHVKESSKYVK